MKKSDFSLKTTYQTDIAEEYEADVQDLQDGYQANVGSQNKDISWDNAHKAVDNLIKANILHFKKKRTIERKVVKNVLYKWLEEYFDLIEIYECNCFILNNQNLFAKMIQDMANKYKEDVEREMANVKPEKKKWTLADSIFVGDIEEVKFSKYAYQRCYLNKNRSSIEKEFEKYIDEKQDVVWWYKNGDNGNTYFSVPYYDETKQETRLFYPDFVIKFSDKIGIYDTKSGQTLLSKETKNKADSLNEYLISRNNLIGGIITKNGTLWKVSKNQFDTDVNEWEAF